jgi:hypothetical protein
MCPIGSECLGSRSTVASLLTRRARAASGTATQCTRRNDSPLDRQAPHEPGLNQLGLRGGHHRRREHRHGRALAVVQRCRQACAASMLSIGVACNRCCHRQPPMVAAAAAHTCRQPGPRVSAAGGPAPAPRTPARRGRQSARPSFMSVHWVGVPEALRARRINRHPYLHGRHGLAAAGVHDVVLAQRRTLKLGLRGGSLSQIRATSRREPGNPPLIPVKQCRPHQQTP